MNFLFFAVHQSGELESLLEKSKIIQPIAKEAKKDVKA